MRRRSFFDFNIVSYLAHLSQDLISSPPFLGVDLGTSQIRIYLQGKGIVLKEKTYIVQNVKTKEFVVFGDEAYDMLGKTPPNLKVFSPMEKGRVSDFDGVVYLLQKCIERGTATYFRNSILSRFNALIGVPLGLTEVEEMAIVEVGQKVGAHDVFLVETPLAAGFGSGSPVMENTGTFLVDMGGGTIEVSLLSLGGVVLYKIVKLGGKDFTEAIINYVRLRYGLLIGEKTAEETKLQIGSVLSEKERVLELSGRSIESGMPKTAQVKANVLYEALFPYFSQLVETIRDAIEQTPPELIKDINVKGIMLTGMSSRFTDLDEFLHKELKITIVMREEPEYDVVRGLGWLVEHRDIMKKLSVKFIK